MLALDLAHALRDAGLTWQPQNGDRFAIPDREMDDQVFVVSNMVIERLQLPAGEVLAFNGTTEWALDSLEAGEALWLPREDQLRDELGEAFLALERLAGEPAGYAVTVSIGGDTRRYVDIDAESAYARALLDLLRR
ncbi:pilus assembly protein CpaE [Nocardioides sp.]|uniref:pilus assembly protein CpaE n=1 Tax=Nocardioides sp. TaxID=35761 RepID=UPI0035278DFB